MKSSRLVLLIAFASFAVGVVLSILYNSLFLFLFLPFGIGWGFSRRAEPKQRRNQEDDEDVKGSAAASG